MSRIFLVDDHPVVRFGFRALLESAGHEVVGEAGEFSAALAGVVRQAPDVVLIDIGLGERSGLELLEIIGRRRLPVRAVVVSASSRPEDVAEAVRLGGLGYVLKDAQHGELLAAVDAAARGQRHLGVLVADLALRGLAARAESPPALSQRERQVLVMVASGKSNAGIGREMSLSPKTVESYRRRSMAKLGLTDVPAVVRWAIREGLCEL